MRMQMTSQIDAGGNDPIFLMFHGYGNDESEMMRILDAVYAPMRPRPQLPPYPAISRSAPPTRGPI